MDALPEARRGLSGRVTPIVALDVADAAEAARMVALLGPRCDFYKVGGELFTGAGPAVVEELVGSRKRVFLDLKFHDIPNTVRAAARQAARLGARLITVHASGGRAMIEAAVDGAGSECRVLAVTVLTSLDAVALGAAWGREQVTVLDEVLRLADLARESGAHGVVCSGQEAAAIRLRHGDGLALLVPGVRLAGGATQDQVRVVTPGQAAAAGASYIILGRAVTAALDPLAALDTVAAELASA